MRLIGVVVYPLAFWDCSALRKADGHTAVAVLGERYQPKTEASSEEFNVTGVHPEDR